MSTLWMDEIIFSWIHRTPFLAANNPLSSPIHSRCKCPIGCKWTSKIHRSVLWFFSMIFFFDVPPHLRDEQLWIERNVCMLFLLHVDGFLWISPKHTELANITVAWQREKPRKMRWTGRMDGKCANKQLTIHREIVFSFMVFEAKALIAKWEASGVLLCKQQQHRSCKEEIPRLTHSHANEAHSVLYFDD